MRNQHEPVSGSFSSSLFLLLSSEEEGKRGGEETRCVHEAVDAEEGHLQRAAEADGLADDGGAEAEDGHEEERPQNRQQERKAEHVAELRRGDGRDDGLVAVGSAEAASVVGRGEEGSGRTLSRRPREPAMLLSSLTTLLAEHALRASSLGGALIRSVHSANMFQSAPP